MIDPDLDDVDMLVEDVVVKDKYNPHIVLDDGDMLLGDVFARKWIQFIYHTRWQLYARKRSLLEMNIIHILYSITVICL